MAYPLKVLSAVSLKRGRKQVFLMVNNFTISACLIKQNFILNILPRLHGTAKMIVTADILLINQQPKEKSIFPVKKKRHFLKVPIN